jgi:hypothetical protein
LVRDRRSAEAALEMWSRVGLAACSLSGDMKRSHQRRSQRHQVDEEQSISEACHWQSLFSGRNPLVGAANAVGHGLDCSGGVRLLTSAVGNRQQ